MVNFCKVSSRRVTLSVVGVERSMSEAARRTSRGRKSGAWCICDAPKARPAGPSPHLGCNFVQRRRKTQMARPEGPSRCFGYCSFVEERRSESLCLCNALAEEAIKRSAEARSAEALRKGEARRAEAKFCVWLICWATVASQILDRPMLSCQSVFRREPARHAAVH